MRPSLPLAPAPLLAARGGVAALVALLGAAACGTDVVELVPVDPPAPPLGPPTDQTRRGELDGAEDPAALLPLIPDPAPGCQRVDFLFVVDNSPSMLGAQESLARSFPGFIGIVERELPGDYRIMVVDTDTTGGRAGVSTLTGLDGGNFSCRPAPACCREGCALSKLPFVGAFVGSCNGRSCAEVVADPSLDDCEGVLGAGKRLSPDGRACGIAAPLRYMESGQPELSSTFSCVAQVGTFGDGNEQPMAAMVSALGPELNAESGCNAGFLRDDAVAVVTIISDEDDTGSPGSPAAWHQALVDAKGGNADAVVVLGLVADANVAGGLPGGPCAANSSGAPLLQQFVKSFRFGSLGSVCAADYAPFFQDAVAPVGQACARFRPVIR